MRGRNRFADLLNRMSPERQKVVARKAAAMGGELDTVARFLIDPPNGHAYGFPKEFEGDIATLDFTAWLRREGYPETEIAHFSGNVPCRVIQLEDD